MRDALLSSVVRRSPNGRGFNSVFGHLKSIRFLNWFNRYRYAPEVLASKATLIVVEKDRWGNSGELEEDGIFLSTLIKSYRHFECTNLLDKVYSLLGLSSDKLSIDYHKRPESVYNEILAYAATPSWRLDTRRGRLRSCC